jgi:hypothetical protein
LVFLDPEGMDRLPDDRPSAEEKLDSKQVLAQLDAAVATLSPGDQLLLALRYEDDRSARQIASLMSLPTPFHVYRRLNRVHVFLRGALNAPLSRGQNSAAHDPSAVLYRWDSDEPSTGRHDVSGRIIRHRAGGHHGPCSLFPFPAGAHSTAASPHRLP